MIDLRESFLDWRASTRQLEIIIGIEFSGTLAPFKPSPIEVVRIKCAKSSNIRWNFDPTPHETEGERQ